MKVVLTQTRVPRSFDGNVVDLSSRRNRPERDFGVGYGTSSGYASARRYASDWGPTRFRCA